MNLLLCNVLELTLDREYRRDLLWEYAALGGYLFMYYDNHRDEWAVSTRLEQ